MNLKIKLSHWNFIKKNITKWNIGSPILSVPALSKKLKITTYSAKKIVNELISIGVVEQYNNKFYLLSNDLSTDDTSIQNKLLLKAKINIIMMKFLHNKYIHDKKYMSFIDKISDTQVTIYFPLKQKKLIVNILDDTKNLSEEIQDIIKRNNLK